MTPANEQDRNKTTGGTTSGGGMEPSTPAMGASSATTDPAAGGIGINDSMTGGLGPDASQSSAATGSTGGQTGMGGSSMGSAGAGMSGSGGAGGQQTFSRVKEQAREQATKLRSQATDRARTAASSGKDRATQTLDGLAQAVHDAAGNLEQQVNPQIAQYAHRAADALDNLSERLRNKDVDELLNDAQDFMRRSPAVAIGAAVAVGFALSRFLKATSSPSTGSYQRNAYALDEDDDEMPSLTTSRTGGSTQPRYNA